MALPSSGAITIAQIAAQFSSVASGYSLSSYNGVGWWLAGGPDDGTLTGTFGRPTSMSSFYNKQGNQPGPWLVWAALGGGGGGGGGLTPTWPGVARGGGAGGGMYPVPPGSTFKRWAFSTASVTIGAGGAGGAATPGGSNGSAGGSTTVTIAGSAYTAPGGGGSNGGQGGTTPPGAFTGGAAGTYGGGGGGSAVANGGAYTTPATGIGGGSVSSWANFSSSFPGYTNFGGGGGGNATPNNYQGGDSGTPSFGNNKSKGGWTGQDSYGNALYYNPSAVSDILGCGGGAASTVPGNQQNAPPNGAPMGVGGSGAGGAVIISLSSSSGGLNYDGNYFGFVYGSNTYYVLTSSGTITTHFKPTGTVATGSQMNGSNGYVGGKPYFTNTSGTSFYGSFTYQGANGSWSVLLPRNSDGGSGFSGQQLVGVHPSSNWSTAELAELGISSPAYGTRYQLKYFGVNQDRGTVMSYGKMTRTAYLAAKAAGGGAVAISVFNNFQSGGNFDGNYAGGNALIPCVLWSHHSPGGRGYANWYYLNPDDRTPDTTWRNSADYWYPNFTSGYQWWCYGTRQGANGQPLLPIYSGYQWTIGVDDIVFPVCDDQNAGGSSQMVIKCNVF
jgi:hypothetical protein